MMFYVVWLMPIIVCWGTLALAISVYTPLLAWVSYPVQWILQFAGIPEAAVTASAIMSGFADNYLPVILGANLTESTSKVVIAMMSILQLIFYPKLQRCSHQRMRFKSFRTLLLFSYNALSLHYHLLSYL